MNGACDGPRAAGAGACGSARTNRSFRPRASPRRRNCSSSAAPVKAGSVPGTPAPWLGGSAVQRVQRPPRVRARTCAWSVRRAAQRRPTRSKRRGAAITLRRAPAGAGRARGGSSRASSKRSGPEVCASAGEGSRSAPSATTPRPRTWRRVTSIRGLQHSMVRDRSGRPACTRSCGETEPKMGMSFSKLDGRCAALPLLLAAAAGRLRRRARRRRRPARGRDDDPARRHGAQRGAVGAGHDAAEGQHRPARVRGAPARREGAGEGRRRAALGRRDRRVARRRAGQRGRRRRRGGRRRARPPGLEGDDPHWWQDPRRAERAATAIGRAIPGADAAPYVRAAARARRARSSAASTRCRARSGGS